MSVVPPVLRARLAEAMAWVERTGTVSIWHRQAIYAALGQRQPLGPLDYLRRSLAVRQKWERQRLARHDAPLFGATTIVGRPLTPGHLRRTALAIHTLEYDFRVWQNPRWYRQKRRDAFVRMMALVRQAAAGQPADPATVAALRVDLQMPGEWYQDDSLLLAAGRAYDVAMADVDFQLDPLPPFHDDADLTKYQSDVPGLATMLAGDEFRATFWVWWLTHAAPQAWAAHPS